VKPVRVVFYLNRFTYIRFFESVLRALVGRGHEVVLLLERRPTHDYEERWVEEFERDPRFTYRRAVASRKDPIRGFRRDLRKTADYLHFLRPRFDRTPALRRRARARAPERVARLSELPLLRTAPVRGLATAIVERFDHAIPPSPALLAEIRELQPDIVVVSPHGMPGELDSDYVKAARELGVPSAVAIASWDNLSSKQLLHERPDRLLVWNETQRAEAVELHHVPERQVVVTGAQNFDLWFDWRPSPRRAFCERQALDPERPYVLYVGGSLYPAEITEAEWVRRWLGALRSSDDAVLARAGALLRPHPCRADEWADASYDDFENVGVWRSAYREMPVADEARAEFFDSIYHAAAVVGLNTSAMIEAAIVGRVVHTVIAPEFATSQQGVFHFDYLLNVGGGLTRIARSLDEHVEQLADTLHGRDLEAEARRRRFLQAFVRPYGLDAAATPRFVDALEELASLSVVRRSARIRARLLRRAIRAATRSRGVDRATVGRAGRRLRSRLRRALGRAV
jgi:hypothetical protein